MMPHEDLQSPRLASLYATLKSGDAAALDAFWRDVAAMGTPLIESADDDRDVLVTFLWRDDGGTAHIDVIGGVGKGGGFAATYPMQRLAETDVWFRTDRVRADVRSTYALAPNNPTAFAPLAEQMAHWHADPLNPRTFVFPDDATGQGRARSVVEGPAVPPQPWGIAQPGAPAGKVRAHRLYSSILGNERDVWVYTPPGFSPDAVPDGLLILFDGWEYLHLVPTPTILDNLLAAHKIPPLVAVLIGNIDGKTRMRELMAYQPFGDFLTQELLPWVKDRYAIKPDSARTIVAGASAGGLTAAFVALRHPELFGNVLSQSGSFWWKPHEDEEFEWLAHQVVTSPPQQVRLYLEVGLLESGPGLPGGSQSPAQIVANRHLRDVLRAKGYRIHYHEFNGGHEWICWRGSLADGLLALLGS